MKHKRISVWKTLLSRAQKNGACHLVLLDPGKESAETIIQRAALCEKAGVDGLLLGGSTMNKARFCDAAKRLYRSSSLPVILFPGSANQVTHYADAILFMSLVSGRNPDFLIRQQVTGAPLVKKFGLETIPTAYVLIESGSITSVERASRTHPLSRTDTKGLVAHALAAQFLGMQAIYLEAGSGAKMSVPQALIKSVADATSLAVIAGGGIRTPAQAAAKVRAGARFIVTGTVFEEKSDLQYLKEMRNAVISTRRRK